MPAVAEMKKREAQKSSWAIAKRFVAPTTRVHSSNVALLLYARAFMWFHKIADFRYAEMVLLYEQNPSKRTSVQHRKIIEILIGEGEEIMRQIHADGDLIKAENGFSLDDIESAIQELKNTSIQWHGRMTKKRKKEILGAIFDASERGIGSAIAGAVRLGRGLATRKSCLPKGLLQFGEALCAQAQCDSIGERIA